MQLWNKNQEQGKCKQIAIMCMYRVIRLVPISNEDGVITGRGWEWDRYQRPTENPDATEPAGGLVERKRGEVIEASDLVLDLKDVGEVLAGRDRACGSIDSILIGVPPLLDSIPAYSCFLAPN